MALAFRLNDAHGVSLALALVLVAGAGWDARAASPTAKSQASSADTAAIWCHDPVRAIVIRKPRWRCKGEVVDDGEAARIKAERVRRIQGVLKSEDETVVPGRRLAGSGTGFFFTGRGHLLTNAHVVKECTEVTVIPAGEAERIVTVIAAAPRRDLAVLDTGRATSHPAVFARSFEFGEDEELALIGYPLHGKVMVKPRMVTGHLHGGARTSNANVFVMKMPVRHGNSGGPILDVAARVVGVVYAKLDTTTVFARTGKRVRNVGLGIRLPLVRDFLRQAKLTMDTTDEVIPLDRAARFERAREFVAQVHCYR